MPGAALGMLYLFAAAAAVFGLALLAASTRGADENAKSVQDVLAALGTTIIGGCALVVVVSFFQARVQAEASHGAAETAFRNQVIFTADLAGFSPPVTRTYGRGCRKRLADRGRSLPSSVTKTEAVVGDLRGYGFTGKLVRSAELDGLDLQHASFRDADLRNASLRCADLRDAGLRGANLTDAALTGARLDRADLRYATLRRTTTWHVRSWADAVVDESTCWRSDTDLTPIARAVHAAWRQRSKSERITVMGHICDTGAIVNTNGIEDGRSTAVWSRWEAAQR